MDDMIKRVKNATEPSRELDAEIWLLEGGPAYAFRQNYPGQAPEYTSNFEAALELMPADANCHGYDCDPIMKICAYFSRNNVKSGHWVREGYHATSVPMAFVLAFLEYRKNLPAGT